MDSDNNKDKTNKSEDFKQFLRKFLKKVYVGACVKIIKLLLFSQLNFRKVYNEKIGIAKFGIMCGTIFLLYRATRMIIKKLNIETKIDLEIFIAAVVSSLPLLMVE